VAWFLLIAIKLVKLFRHTIQSQPSINATWWRSGISRRIARVLSLPRPRLELFFVKSFYCSELKNFSAASLHFYFMASFLH